MFCLINFINNLHSTLKPLKSEFFHVSLAEINSKHAKSCIQYQHEIITKCKVGFFPEGKFILLCWLLANVTHYPHYYENVFPGVCSAADEEGDVTLEDDIGKSRDGSRTDDEAVQR